MIHVFHGFLGSPSDFDFLKTYPVKIHDLYQMQELPAVSAEDTLIGYSMGGRIALEIAAKNDFDVKKLILISAHPGLATDEEKFQRLEFETKVINELKNQKREAFLEWWNSLPIFHFDGPINVSDERYQQSAELFERFRLSKQANFLPEILKHKEKVLYIMGLFDEKYMDLASEELIPHGISVKGVAGGHRLHQHPEDLLKIFKDENVL